MGLWINSPYASPVPSFPQPVSPPATEPDAGPTATIKVNCAWLPFIRGALLQLTLQSTWLGTQADVNLAQDRANKLISMFAGNNPCDCDIPCLPEQTGVEAFLSTGQITVDCDCNVFIECCDGTKVQLLTTKFNPPRGGNPGGGTPQAGPGQQTEQCFTLGSQSSCVLPWPVSSGDTILLTNLYGAWRDRTRANWNCADGFIFAAGDCFGTVPSGGTDPVPTSLHMSIVGEIEGTFYEVLNIPLFGTEPTAFTIPPGYSNATMTLQANTPDLSNTDGDVSFCVQYKNNGVAHWSHLFNFLDAPGGFIPVAAGALPPRGQWVAGQGWVTTDVTSGPPAANRGIAIKLGFPATTITRLKMTYNLTKGTFSSGAIDALSTQTNNGGANIYSLLTAGALVDGSGQNADMSSTFTNQTSTELGLECAENNSNIFDGAAAITSLLMEGDGVNPFA